MSSKKATAASESYWERFVDALMAPLVILSQDGVILYVNQAACELFGKSKQNLLSSAFSSPIKVAQTTEIEMMDSKGRHRIAEMMTQPCQWKNQAAWAATLKDITQKKQDEQQLKVAAHVFNFAKEGIVITDTSGVIIDVNQEFTHITQYEKQEIIGKKISILSSGKHEKIFYESMWAHIIQHGYWYGEIWNKKKNGEIYPQLEAISEVKNEVGDVINYVGVFYDITQQETQKRELEHLVHYDSLTHLPNRLLVTSRIEEAIHHSDRDQQYLAVVFIDLDDFKHINDTYGHHLGDLLLKRFAHLVQKLIRETDTLARYGGDEFILLLTHLDDHEQFYPLLIRIYDVLHKPLLVEQHAINLKVSMGVTTYPQTEHKTA